MENLVFVSGRLTADSDIKYYESGKCKATFTLAVDGYFNKEKITSFIKCEAWGKQAEFAAEYFKKGKNISVFGELTSNEYNGKMYYSINCKTANFASSQIVIKGMINDVSDKKIKVHVGNDLIEAECYLKDVKAELKEKTIVSNLGFKDYKPVYSVVSIL